MRLIDALKFTIETAICIGGIAALINMIYSAKPMLLFLKTASRDRSIKAGIIAYKKYHSGSKVLRISNIVLWTSLIIGMCCIWSLVAIRP